MNIPIHAPTSHALVFKSPGADESLGSFDARMTELGYDMAFTGTVGLSGAALGNRIAATSR